MSLMIRRGALGNPGDNLRESLLSEDTGGGEEEEEGEKWKKKKKNHWSSSLGAGNSGREMGGGQGWYRGQGRPSPLWVSQSCKEKEIDRGGGDGS